MARLSREISKGLPKGLFAAVALSLTFGAVPSGRDLVQQESSSQVLAADASAIAINRGAKTDRAARASGPTARTQTISLRLNGLADTSVLVRIPVVNQASNDTTASRPMKSGGGTTEACEPVVSVLTEIAKRLQPGRCVT